MFDNGIYLKKWKVGGQGGSHEKMLDLQTNQLLSIDFYHGKGIKGENIFHENKTCIYGIKLGYQSLFCQKKIESKLFGSKSACSEPSQITSIHFLPNEKIVEISASYGNPFWEAEALSAIRITTNLGKTYTIGDLSKSPATLPVTDYHEITQLSCRHSETINALIVNYAVKPTRSLLLKIIAASSFLFAYSCLPSLILNSYFSSVMGKLNGFLIAFAAQSSMNQVLFSFLFPSGENYEWHLFFANLFSGICATLFISWERQFSNIAILYIIWQFFAFNLEYLYDNLINPLLPEKKLVAQEKIFEKKRKLEQDIKEIEHKESNFFVKIIENFFEARRRDNRSNNFPGSIVAELFVVFLLAMIIGIILMILQIMLIVIRLLFSVILPLFLSYLVSNTTVMGNVPDKSAEFWLGALFGFFGNFISDALMLLDSKKTPYGLIEIGRYTIFTLLFDMHPAVLKVSIYIALTIFIQNVTGFGNFFSTTLAAIATGVLGSLYFLKTDERLGVFAEIASPREATPKKLIDIENKHKSISRALLKMGVFASSLTVIASQYIENNTEIDMCAPNEYLNI